MRIAFSGAHRTGKTSLVDELLRLVPEYVSFDEPYHLMLEEGYEFCHPPSLEDFEAQLERSLELLAEEGANVFFDRCPIDFIGYILSHEDADRFAIEDWLPRVHAACGGLDLIVFVPVEAKDRILFSASDNSKGDRLAVDEMLREFLWDDSLNLGVQVLGVEGDLAARAEAVIREICAGR